MRDWIGVFDSGMGGISVLHAARRLLPNENFLYYGDNGNAPYGSRTVEEIRRLAGTAIDQLLDRGVKAIVIACNTATSAYAEILRARLALSRRRSGLHAAADHRWLHGLQKAFAASKVRRVFLNSM